METRPAPVIELQRAVEACPTPQLLGGALAGQAGGHLGPMRLNGRGLLLVPKLTLLSRLAPLTALPPNHVARNTQPHK